MHPGGPVSKYQNKVSIAVKTVCIDFFELFDTLLQVISVVIKTQAKVFGLFITVFGAVPSVLKKNLSSEFITSVSIFLDRKEA